MKVLFVSSGTRNSGPNPIVFAQGESLKKCGITLDYFTINKGGANGYAKAIFDLRRLLKSKKYDIIHAHYGLAAINSFLAKQGQKIIVSFMGDDLLGTNKENQQVTKKSLLFARFNAFLARKFYNFSIVKSKEMQKKLHTEQVRVIPNGVNIDLFRPELKKKARKQLGIQQDEKLVIFVSNPDRAEKNFALAEQAVKLTEIPDLRLKALFEVDQKNLVNYYNAADALVLTSFHEGSPNVIKEAMACNCPIVTTDVGDVKWVLDKTKGCFIGSYNPADFAKQLKIALAFAHKNNRTNGRERIIELGLDSTTIASKLINIYQNVLENKNGTS
jgi:glycosyltransferase involved in cell wall biosynthesis